MRPISKTRGIGGGRPRLSWPSGMFGILLLMVCAAHRLMADTPRLVWSDRGNNTIRSSESDGSQIRLHQSGLGEARGVDADPIREQLFYADNGRNLVQRSAWDGANTQTLIDNGLQFPAGVAVDPVTRKVYWADQGTSRIERSNWDGTQREVLVNETQLDSPYFVALDLSQEWLYWTDYGSRKIQRAKLDGTQVQDLVTIEAAGSLLRGIDLDLSAGKIYWTDRGTDRVQRANLDGSNVETLHKIVPPAGVDAAPHGIVVDKLNGRLYWVDNGTVKIQSSTLDGSDVVDVMTVAQGVLSRPWEIFLDYRAIDDPPRRRCDVNWDARCTFEDIDMLTRATRWAPGDPAFDLTGDGRVDQADRDYWVGTAMGTTAGDANLDGRFNSSDLVGVFGVGEYEDGVGENSVWSEGDWNGDRDFSTTDLVVAFAQGGYERAGIAASVPEPTGGAVAGFCGALAICRMQRVQRRRPSGGE